LKNTFGKVIKVDVPTPCPKKSELRNDKKRLRNDSDDQNKITKEGNLMTDDPVKMSLIIFLKEKL
jgi:hypothetical protein